MQRWITIINYFSCGGVSSRLHQRNAWWWGCSYRLPWSSGCRTSSPPQKTWAWRPRRNNPHTYPRKWYPRRRWASFPTLNWSFPRSAQSHHWRGTCWRYFPSWNSPIFQQWKLYRSSAPRRSNPHWGGCWSDREWVGRSPYRLLACIPSCSRMMTFPAL